MWFFLKISGPIVAVSDSRYQWRWIGIDFGAWFKSNTETPRFESFRNRSHETETSHTEKQGLRSQLPYQTHRTKRRSWNEKIIRESLFTTSISILFTIDRLNVLIFIRQEWQNLEMMQNRTKNLREETISWRIKYDALKKFAIDNKIPIPPELENPWANTINVDFLHSFHKFLFCWRSSLRFNLLKKYIWAEEI